MHQLFMDNFFFSLVTNPTTMIESSLLPLHRSLIYSQPYNMKKKILKFYPFSFFDWLYGEIRNSSNRCIGPAQTAFGPIQFTTDLNSFNNILLSTNLQFSSEFEFSSALNITFEHEEKHRSTRGRFFLISPCRLYLRSRF